jgi:hypothetical protein
VAETGSGMCRSWRWLVVAERKSFSKTNKGFTMAFFVLPHGDGDELH